MSKAVGIVLLVLASCSTLFGQFDTLDFWRPQRKWYGTYIYGERLKIDRKVKIYDPIDSLACDSVVCYNFDVDSAGGNYFTHERNLPIVLDSQVVDSNVCSARTLKTEDINVLRKLFTNPDLYVHRHMGCFIPHLVFVFFSKKKVVGTVYVCFMCADIAASFYIPARSYFVGKGALNNIGYLEFKKLCESLKMAFIE